MFVSFNNLIKKGDRVAVALSGGKDSMALLHYLISISNKEGFSVVALNVEHGIRGEQSLNDTNFVKNYCASFGIPLLEYSVDSLSYAKENKLSIEQSARKLRYDCFFDALNNGKCDKVATAHHSSDNAESILFNLLRGSSLKGVSGITPSFNDKIIRPFLSVSKEEIENYIIKNNIPFVTDQTNYDDDYTRNFLRLNVIPEIKTVFPEMEKSLTRFAEVCKIEDEFLDSLARKKLLVKQNAVEISIPCEKALFNRAVVIALKNLGVIKDWEKAHIDAVYSLNQSNNGAKVNLLCDITAIREYDKITLYLNEKKESECLPLTTGTFDFCGKSITLQKLDRVAVTDLKSGLYLDFEKLPKTAVIRAPKSGDLFTKFGGGTKKLCDFLTDEKIPQRLRPTLPIIASDNTVYAVFDVAVSQKAKVDQNTKTIIKLS